MARATTAVARQARVLHAARGYLSPGKFALLRRRRQPGENRRALPLLRAVRPCERENGEILLRGVVGRRGRDRAADAALPGGEALARAVPPPSPGGLLGRGVEQQIAQAPPHVDPA